jgi:hypothetical protein
MKNRDNAGPDWEFYVGNFPTLRHKIWTNSQISGILAVLAA